MIRRAMLVAVALVVLGGCSSSSSDGEPKRADKAPSSQATEAPGREFFEEVAASTAGSYEKVLGLAAPGSPAAGYAAHLYYSTLALGEDGAPGKLKVKPDGFAICEEDCTDFTEVTLAGDKVQDFKLAGTAMSEVAFAGTGNVVKLGNLGKAEVVASFLGPVSKKMFVTVRFTSPPGKTIATNYVAYYKGPDKRQVETTDQTGPTTLQPDSVSYNTFAFTNTGFGGTILVKVANDDFDAGDAPVSKALETAK